MQYQVPQFIEIEDKVFGPLTFHQFIYILGGVGATVVLWKTLPHFIAVFLIAPILVLAGLLAFYKVHGRPFVAVLEAAISYFIRGKLYLWHKEDKKRGSAEAATVVDHSKRAAPRLTENRLSELSWSLDIKEKL